MSTHNLGFDAEFMAEMLGEFLDESQGYLNDLNENLLDLEQQARSLGECDALQVDAEQLNVMFRAAHSLKGLSAMLGLNDINHLTHKMENVLDAARGNELPVTGNVVDIVFQSVDRLAQLIDGLRSDDPGSVEYKYESESVIGRIRSLLDRPAEIAPPQQAKTQKEAAADPSCETATVDFFAGIEDDSDVPQKYLAIFIEETATSLDELSDLLLADDLGESADPLLITCHKIKGSAAAVGLRRAARLAHFMEDLLQDLREAGSCMTPTLTDALLRSVDVLRDYVDSLRTGAECTPDFNGAYLDLQTAGLEMQQADGASRPTVTDGPAGNAAGPDVPALDDAFRERVRAIGHKCHALIGIVSFQPGLPLIELKAQLVCRNMAESGELFFCDPPEDQFDSLATLTHVAFGLATDVTPNVLRSRLRLDGIVSVEVESLSSEDQETPEVQETPAVRVEKKSAANLSTKSKPTETIRVDIERLDQMMNLAGQLVINKSRFGQIDEKLKSLTNLKPAIHSLTRLGTLIDRLSTETESLKDTAASQGIRDTLVQMRTDLESARQDVALLAETRSLVGELSEAVHQLDRVTDGIQKTVMDTRMVPIGPLFTRFKRVIRDITRDNGKEIRLVIQGEHTELDKRMIDELGDPLIHMIRNAADHGIESPEERVKQGKTPNGTVTLDAFQRGNRVFIRIHDDGRGIDPEKIKRKAIEKGLISASDAERMTNHQILQLIWEPGFTTAEQVTEVSGRGMGMDIVLSKITELNGTVELKSEPGEGSTFTIVLPLTMAILPSLLAEVAGDVYAFPVESVVEIVRVGRKELGTVCGLATACVRGRVVSVVNLWDLFDWGGEPHPETSGTDSDVTLVIVGVDGQELGLIVHNLLGEEDIVIKSLAENFRNVTGLAGASILGDGRVSLILDIGALLQLACRKQADDKSQHVSDLQHTETPAMPVGAE